MAAMVDMVDMVATAALVDLALDEDLDMDMDMDDEKVVGTCPPAFVFLRKLWKPVHQPSSSSNGCGNLSTSLHLPQTVVGTCPPAFIFLRQLWEPVHQPSSSSDSCGNLSTSLHP
ncbi:uncharacterized protein [Cherax quadricarinatus]|uniref:uncharacterized protein n=1 Tax=Cherax quadricarinatus TaxID=27406 RepID=UPI00387E31A3